MRRRDAFSLVLAGATAALAAPHARRALAATASGELSEADIIAAVSPGVVNVSTVLESHGSTLRSAQDTTSDTPPDTSSDTPRGAMPAITHGFGSGFVIDKSGIILTNRHVVERAIRITVTLQDNTTLVATRIGRSSRADVALLRVTPSEPLQALALGDSDEVRVGDHVIAIGNPLGLGGSVSSGIVSGLNRDIRTTPFDDFIQTDAAINHGNSGGPLFNRAGQVIGINTAIYSPTETGGSIGISFALPINDAKFIVDQTLRFGRVRAGWLGISMQSVTPDIAKAIGLGVPRGSIVAAVDHGGPAAKAGLREGDVIMSVGQITPRDSRAMWRTIALAPLDQPIELTVWRDGSVDTLTPVVREMPPPVGDTPDAAQARQVAGQPYDTGLQLAALNAALRAKYRVAPGTQGVLVTAVSASSPAAERGLVVGDVIMRAGQNPIARPSDLAPLLTAARDHKQQYMLLLIRGPSGQRFVTLPLHPES